MEIDIEALRASLPKPKVFQVGDEVEIYIGNHQGERTPGVVVAVLNLDGWLFPQYVIECEIGAPDPILEVRDGLLGMVHAPESCPAQGDKS